MLRKNLHMTSSSSEGSAEFSELPNPINLSTLEDLMLILLLMSKERWIILIGIVFTMLARKLSSKSTITRKLASVTLENGTSVLLLMERITTLFGNLTGLAAEEDGRMKDAHLPPTKDHLRKIMIKLQGRSSGLKKMQKLISSEEESRSGSIDFKF